MNREIEQAILTEGYRFCRVQPENIGVFYKYYQQGFHVVMMTVNPGWAEQDPESWWENLKLATQAIMTESGVSAAEIKAIGISYQMHGLVCVDKNQHVLRPAIIWCDSRAAQMKSP